MYETEEDAKQFLDLPELNDANLLPLCTMTIDSRLLESSYEKMHNKTNICTIISRLFSFRHMLLKKLIYEFYILLRVKKLYLKYIH